MAVQAWDSKTELQKPPPSVAVHACKVNTGGGCGVETGAWWLPAELQVQ